MPAAAVATTYHRDYIFVKNDNNDNIFDTITTLNCDTKKNFIRENLDIIRLDNNKHINGTFFSCVSAYNSITEHNQFIKQNNYQINIKNGNVLTKNKERQDESPIIIKVNPNDNVITTKEYVFIQSEKDLQTGVIQPVSKQDLDIFFHVEYDWGMIVFVTVIVILMMCFAIKYIYYIPSSVAEQFSNDNKNAQHYKSNINVDDEIKKL